MIHHSPHQLQDNLEKSENVWSAAKSKTPLSVSLQKPLLTGQKLLSMSLLRITMIRTDQEERGLPVMLHWERVRLEAEEESCRRMQRMFLLITQKEKSPGLQVAEISAENASPVTAQLPLLKKVE